MRIALVSLAKRGGMVHFLAELAGALAPMAQVWVIASSRADLAYLPATVNRLVVVTGDNRLGSMARALNPATWLRLSRQLRAAQCEIVHIAGVHEWNPLIAILCRWMKIPVVYTVHDAEAHAGAPLAIRIADRVTLRLANKLVTLTKIGRLQLLAQGRPEAMISVVPHPMYTIFRRWKPPRTREQRLMLYFGRLEAYKGLPILIEAFQSVRRSLPGWKLVLAGDGRPPDELSRATHAQIELVNRYVPDAHVAGWMSRAAMVVLPYTAATQSGVVAIAQAFGVPVVATQVGGLGEMVLQGKTGLLVRPGDTKALARALRRLAGDPATRAKMRSELRKIADARWGPRITAKAHLSVYQAARDTRASR